MTRFEGLVRAVATHHPSSPHAKKLLCAQCAEGLRQAVALYHAPLLDQFMLADSAPWEEWLLLKREHYHRLMVDALTQLAHFHKQAGDYNGAQTYLRRHVALEPWQEDAHYRLMELLARAGQRTAALAVYADCRRMLGQELGVAPSRTTTLLWETIKSDQVAVASPVVKRQAARLAQAPPTSPPISRLPAPMTTLIGREAQICSLRARLEQPNCRLLTLTGPGGVGKTRLAIAIADGWRGSEAVCWVPLAEVQEPDYNRLSPHEQALFRALAVFDGGATHEAIATALGGVASIARAQGDTHRARRLYEESLALCRDVHYPIMIAANLRNMGYLALPEEPQRSALLFEEALVLQQGLGDLGGVADCLGGLACVAAQTVRLNAPLGGDAYPLLRGAIRLHSAAAALHNRMRSLGDQVNRADYERHLMLLHGEVDEPSWTTAWTAGQQLSVDEAIAEARGIVAVAHILSTHPALQ